MTSWVGETSPLRTLDRSSRDVAVATGMPVKELLQTVSGEIPRTDLQRCLDLLRD